MSSLTSLPDDPSTLKRLLSEAQARLDDLAEENAYLKEQLLLALRRRFGRSSEAAPGQSTLFDEAEAEAEAPVTAESPDVQVKGHRRKRGGRKPLPADLPRVEVVHELTDEERACPQDGHRLHEIGEEISEQLDVVPAKVRVIRHVRKKYACAECNEYVKRAPLAAQMIPKSQASAGLLAYVATSKYQDALPLYRQEQIFERLGVDIDRTLLASWMVRVGERVEPMLELMRTDLLRADVVHCDETTVQVLKEPGRRPDQKSYMWVQATATGPPIIVYHYAPGRSQGVVKRLFGDYAGTLVTDGYAAYGVLRGTTHAGCWAHVRRKFYDAIKGQKSARAGRARVGFEFVQKLFALEREFATLKPHVRHSAREEHSKPVVDSLREWLDKALPAVAPQSLAGKAVNYLANEWDKLVVFLEDGDVPLSNNLVENKIRPFVIGRKNWMFSDTVRGANASAAIYSFIETTKANNLDPYLYLRWLFEVLPRTDDQDHDALRQLLPHRCDPQRIVDELADLYTLPLPADR